MKYSFILLSFLLVFLLPIISAVPPVSQLQSFTEGFDIKIPLDNIIQANSPFELEVHVINISNGFPITSGIGCYMHLYNSTGKHIYEGFDSIVSHNFDYSFDLTAGNFSKIDFYTAVIQCNNSVMGGISEEILQTTGTGNDLSIPQSYIYILALIGTIMLMIGLVLISFTLPASDTKDESGSIININWLKYLRPVIWMIVWILGVSCVFIIANLGQAYLTNNMIGDYFFAIYTILFRVTIVMLPVYAIWILVRAFQDKETKSLIERGVGTSL